MGIIREKVHSSVPVVDEEVSSDRRAVFLDRDGTVIEDAGFLRSPEGIHLIPGAGAAIRALNEQRIPVCIVSNQSGVARGLLTEDDLHRIHERLQSILQEEGAHIDRFEYCPHHPTEGIAPYRIECDCRKPRPGMLERIAEQFQIALPHSFVVGDKLSDIELGKAVGATTMLVLTGYGEASLQEARAGNVHPDFIVRSLVEAVEHILQNIGGIPAHHE